jgi:hypothetical protein
MALLNELYEFTQDVAKKQQRGYMNFKQFTSYINQAQNDHFVDCFGNPNTYQQGRAKAVVNATETTINRDALRKFIKSVIGTPDAEGKYILPVDYRHFRAANSIQPKYQDTCEDLPRGVVRMAEIKELEDFEKGSAMRSVEYPITYEYPNLVFGDGFLIVYPHDLGKIEFIYYRNPLPAKLAYTVVENKQVYDAANTVELEWGEDEQRQIMKKVWSYLGMNLADPELVQFSEIKSKQ